MQRAEEGKGEPRRARGGLRSTSTNQPPQNTTLKSEVTTGQMVDGIEGGGGSLVCRHDSMGMCDVHGQAQKVLQPKRVWAKGRNGLYGWKYLRTTTYSCRTVTKTNDDTPKPTFVSLRTGSNHSKLKPKKSSILIASSNRCMGANSSGLIDEKRTREDEN